MSRPANSTIGREARKANPALEPLSALVGAWAAVGSHPYVPDTTLHGRAIFEWIEEGAFLRWRSEVHHPQFPSGVAIIGSDGSAGHFRMLYFDERDVSRMYDLSVEGNVVRWQRTSTEFAQRMELTIARDGQTMVCKGEMSRDGGAWEPDLALTYTRIERG